MCTCGPTNDSNEVGLSNEITRVVHVTSIGHLAAFFLVEHFRLLRQAGFEAILVCPDDDNARSVVQTSSARFVPLSIKQDISPFSDCVSLFQLWRLFRRLRPDIVDAHMSKAGLLGSLAAWLARVPIRIYHSHGMAVLSARGWKYWLLYLTESIACRCATEVIFVSPSNKQDIVNLSICPREKAVILGPGTICGIDPNTFNPKVTAKRGMELRQQAGIPPGSWIVGFVGRIVPHKGIGTILEAWRLLPESIRSNAYLCMFGGLGKPRMYALVKEATSNPELHIKYMGFSHELPAWYTTMTLLVQASWHEGWGYNVLEAACSGVPAIGTRISATVDAIIDGKTGLIVPVKDPESMAKAIVKLLRDDDLRQRLGRAARERAISEFTKDKICPLLIEEYRRLLSDKESYNKSRIPVGYD